MTTIDLRPFTEDDLPELVRLANDPAIAATLTDAFPQPYTEESGRAFLARVMADAPTRVFCITADGLLAGAVGIHPRGDIWHRNAELGYWVARPYWGRGIATEAVRRAVKYAFGTFPLDRVFARPFGSNAASQRVLEKTAFVLEARLRGTIVKNGRVEDELIYAVRRDDDDHERTIDRW